MERAHSLRSNRYCGDLQATLAAASQISFSTFQTVSRKELSPGFGWMTFPSWVWSLMKITRAIFG